MKVTITLFAGAGAIAVAGMAVVAAPGSAAPTDNPPIATYWMDVTTQSGMGGMGAGATPDMSQIMGMMNGQAPAVSHSLRLRLASRTAAPQAPRADHLIPPAMRMGPSLPLITPLRAEPEPVGPVDARGKLTIYWGCGEHVGPGQPLVVELASLANGKVPESVKRMAITMGRSPHSYSGPQSAPGFGEWPNRQDARPVAPGASLAGSHRVQSNYAPEIDFTLKPDDDFMGPMAISEAGSAPSGARIVRWNAVPRATGYALALFGGNERGETVMWSSVKNAGFANLDYLTPADAAKAVASGDALAPSITQCLLPSEVAQAIPMGMMMGVAYGPQLHFAEAPKNPKWAVTVRYKSNGSLMFGMADMMGTAKSRQNNEGVQVARASLR